MKKIVYSLCLVLSLVACGGGTTESPRQAPQIRTDYSSLKQAKLEPGPLKQASPTDLAELVKNGLRISLRENKNFNEQVRTATLGAASTATADAKSASNFSGTNVQVENVDEADVVKYDGRYIYAATSVIYDEVGPKAGLKIFETDPAKASSKEISDTKLDTSQWGDVSDLYLVSDSTATSGLVTVRRSWNFIAFTKAESLATDSKAQATSIAAGDDAKRLLPQHMNNGIEVSIYDVRSPAVPAKAWTVTLDGDLLASRKIGNTLYLVSSYVPALPTLNYAAITKAELEENENLIEKTALEKLLPTYALNGGESQPLNKTSCLIPANTAAINGYLNLINVTTIDLKLQKMVSSVCINSNVSGVYSSLNSLYLGGSNSNNWENWSSYSVIHKFNYTSTGVGYEGTGSVEGTLGWNQPSYRMDEHNNALRVVTTRYNEMGEPIHQLSVLQKVQGRSELEVVAQLPNKLQPEAIGKPREDIYAVRFDSDRAFVVTFERKDPLYVLDLADVKNPKIAGQLEIPGFSTYLRPLGDNYIFSLGNDADANGRPTGLKVSLFDIRDITKPALIGNHVFGDAGSWSEALYNPHALTFLQNGSDQFRVTVPMVLYKNQVVKDVVEYRWLNTASHMFEINGVSNKASLSYVGNLVAESNEQTEYPWGGYSRSVLHDNAVYYLHDAKVHSSFWPVSK